MSSRPGVVLLLGSAFLAAACDRQAAAPEQATASAGAPDEVAAAPALTAPARGGFDRTHRGEAAPDAAFIGPGGEPARLSDFRGKPLLVNLWATWCAPCVTEMPTLAAAAAKLGDRARVVTVSQDLEEAPAKVEGFLRDRKLPLPAYRDPKLALSSAYAANLPVTVLYGSDGREVWRRSGGFEWASADALRAIGEAR